jgi:hypothetical protein
VTFGVPYWINCPHNGICGLTFQTVHEILYHFFLSHNGMLFVSNPFLWFYVVWIQAPLSQRKKLRVTHTGLNTFQKEIKKLILSTGSAGWKWWLCQWYFLYTKLGFLWLWKWKLLGTPKGVTKWTLLKSRVSGVSRHFGLCLFLKATNPISCHFLHDFNINGTGVQPLSEMNCTVIVRMAV